MSEYGGFVILVHDNGTNSYKFSYTNQNYEDRFNQLRYNLKDNIRGELELVKCIEVYDLQISRNYFNSLYGEYYKNNWLILTGDSVYELIEIMDNYDDSGNYNSNSGGGGGDDFTATVVAIIFSILIIGTCFVFITNSKYRNCVFNGGGIACNRFFNK